MSVLLVIPAALLGLLLLVILLPFRARVRGSVHEGDPSGEIRLDWALGILSVGMDARRRVALRVVRLPVARFHVRPRERRTEKDRRRRTGPSKREKKGAGPQRRLGRALREREALLRMAARLARALHLRLRAEGNVGTGDPADTAALGALAAALGALPGVELRLGLDWLEETLDVDLELAARIWIAELLAVAAFLLVFREHRQAVRAVLSRT